MRPPGGGFGPMMNGPYMVERAHEHGHRGLGWLVAFILIALVVALVVWVVLRFTGGRAGAPALVARPVDDALDIVRRRYAQGEIDRREFLRIIGDLGAPAEPSPAARA